MKCCTCLRDQDEVTLVNWFNLVAPYVAKHQHLNAHLHCPRCLPGPKERCIGCGLHMPQGMVFRRKCPLCRKTKNRDRDFMTKTRFNKLYRET